MSAASPVAARPIAADFAVTGQVAADQMAGIAAAGYRALICARPDSEEPGQPAFAEIAAAAKAAGLEAAHIPVSGPLTECAIIRMEQAMAELPRPILGYCRSGARAGSLYAAVNR